MFLFRGQIRLDLKYRNFATGDEILEQDGVSTVLAFP